MSSEPSALLPVQYFPQSAMEYHLNFRSGVTEVFNDDVITSEPTTSNDSSSSRVSVPIYKVMQPDDLFELSTCSEECKRNTASLHLGITRIDFNNGNLRALVANRNNDNDETKVEVTICEQRYLPSKLKRLTSYIRMKIWPVIRYRKIHETVYEIVMSRKEFTIHTIDVPATYVDLLHHFFSIFPNEAPLLSLDLRGIRNQFFDVETKVLDVFDQCRLCPCLIFKVQNNEAVEQTHRILEKMSALENLKVDVVAEGTEFFSPKMCEMNNLYITYRKNSISETNLLSLNCSTIKLWSATIGATSLNKFIKKWLASTNTKLQYLEMPCVVLDEKDSDTNDILKDLDVMEFDQLRRASFFSTQPWNFEFNCQGKQRFIKCRRGWDIERQDGLLATILHEQNLFYFLVWHERCPEQPEEYIRFLDSE
ncbi:hypothetical protein CAEBREN_05713 [Caenorhabditis brenneri]|uniref:Sdz-33 F-box domain-containing protein n=1 Tax=Caenorhabditis brenneri TaxID=135651 RepID=G0MJV0_CAEBE|nr:hypothetical protein CAEBREN_05713 [Caenorhabditis brenneri]